MIQNIYPKYIYPSPTTKKNKTNKQKKTTTQKTSNKSLLLCSFAICIEWLWHCQMRTTAFYISCQLEKSRASTPRSLGCDHSEPQSAFGPGKMVTENKPPHRPRVGQMENFRKGEAQRTLHHLVSSTWLCKSIQKLQKEKKSYWFMRRICFGLSISWLFYTGVLLLLLYLN